MSVYSTKLRLRESAQRIPARFPKWIGETLSDLAGAVAAHAYVKGLAAGTKLLALMDRLQFSGADENLAVTRSARFESASGFPERTHALRIAVGVATTGRPAIVAQMLARLERQSRQPDAIVIAIPCEADLDAGSHARPDLRILFSDRGASRQRNVILDALRDVDLICFFDDDFVAGDDYLAAVVRAFEADPTLVAATGHVLADGINGSGYSFGEAERVLADGTPNADETVVPVYSAYGCNMIFRCSAIRAGAVRFDEALPAYSWLEDLDFSRRIASFGGVARIEAAVGVHLGVKSGRTSGRRFGYSQISNPIYLVRKGTFAWPRAVWLMTRNVGRNLTRSVRPESYIDRRGRLAGNFAALIDLLRGRMHPTRINDMR